MVARVSICPLAIRRQGEGGDWRRFDDQEDRDEVHARVVQRRGRRGGHQPRGDGGGDGALGRVRARAARRWRSPRRRGAAGERQRDDDRDTDSDERVVTDALAKRCPLSRGATRSSGDGLHPVRVRGPEGAGGERRRRELVAEHGREATSCQQLPATGLPQSPRQSVVSRVTQRRRLSDRSAASSGCQDPEMNSIICAT